MINHLNKIVSEAYFSKLKTYENLSTTKLTDDKKNPLLVYHGTDKEFKEFSLSLLGSSTSAKTSFLGLYFTDDFKVAEYFANIRQSEKSKVLKCFLNFHKPFLFERPYKIISSGKSIEIDYDSFSDYRYDPFFMLRSAIKSNSRKDDWKEKVTSDDIISYKNRLIEEGYDSIILKAVSNDIPDWKGNEYYNFFIAFFPEQIFNAETKTQIYDPDIVEDD